ncbi:MAG: alpha/beta hydrolase [Granulosicoccus sp.]|nr:alpha/beta hydrolase [Granulosicoccus sp.]
MSLMLKTVQTKNSKVTYFVCGQGASICLLPSSGRGGRDFFKLAVVLEELGFQVIAPNPPGVEGSSTDNNSPDFHDLAADAVAAISNETDKCIVAGHAFGNWIARTIASTYSLATGLVLIAAGAKQWPANLSSAIDCLASESATTEERLAALRLAFFTQQYFKNRGQPDDWLNGWYPQLIEIQRNARIATDINSWWHSGSVPILDLIALQDPFRPEDSYADYTSDFGRRTTIATIDQASHALPYEQPAAVANAIYEWSLRVNLTGVRNA